MPDTMICKRPRSQDVFSDWKKNIFFLHNSTVLTDTSFIQLDFIFIIFMIDNKFISYFDDDRKFQGP